MGKATSKQEGEIPFSTRGRVILPQEEQFLPVPVSFWKRIVERIKKIGEPTNTLESIGWASIGFGGSSLLSSIAFPFSATFVRSTPGGNDMVSLGAVLTQFVLI